MVAATERVSLLPKDAVVGGSLSDVDAVIYKARFASWDYRGKQAAVCALLVTYIPAGQEFEDEASIPDHFTQAYSCGPLDKYTPSDDGTYVIPAGSAKGFNKSSNVVAFLTALVNKGFPEDRLAQSDISLLDGMGVHLVQVTQPKREGLKGGGEGEAKGIVLIDKILNLPGEAAAPAAAPAAAKPAATGGKIGGGTKPAAAAKAPAAGKVSASDPDIIAAAQAAIMQIVSQEPGQKATKATIAGKIFKVVDEPDTARKNAIIQAAYKDDTLKTGPWNFDGTTVSIEG